MYTCCECSVAQVAAMTVLAEYVTFLSLSLCGAPCNLRSHPTLQTSTSQRCTCLCSTRNSPGSRMSRQSIWASTRADRSSPATTGERWSWWHFNRCIYTLPIRSSDLLRGSLTMMLLREGAHSDSNHITSTGSYSVWLCRQNCEIVRAECSKPIKLYYRFESDRLRNFQKQNYLIRKVMIH